MLRRLALGVFVAAAMVVVASPAIRAEKPDGILCTIETPKGSKTFPIPIPPKGGNMGDAVKQCLDMGGHPSGVYTGKPPLDGPKK